MTYEEFVSYYEKYHRFPDGQFCREKKLNELQLKTKFKKYEKNQDKQKEKRQEQLHSKKYERLHTIDEKWENCKKIVDKRDNRQCRLFPLLTIEERKLVEKQLHGYNKVLDRAHVFRRTIKHMKYMTDNVYTLYRLFHNRLDQYLDPIYGTPISVEESIKWWKRIIGESKYEFLLETSKKIP